MKVLVFTVLTGFLICSFLVERDNNVSLSPQKFIAYVAQNENKLSKKVEQNSIVYELKYIPTDLLYLTYMKGRNYTKGELKSFQRENHASSSFQLRISTPQNGSIEFLKHPNQNGKSYEERVKFYSFELQQHIHLTDEKGNDYACTGYTFERNYGLQPYGVIHLVFPVNILKKKVFISVHDTGISDNQIQFDFSKTDLQVPTMKYTKQ